MYIQDYDWNMGLIDSYDVKKKEKKKEEGEGGEEKFA